jgi:hypothetical protein
MNTQQIDISSHPYGLGGGTVLSGSISASVSGFVYYPITNVTGVSLNFPNLISGSVISNASISAGVAVYGYINAVSQSSGISIVYSGAPNTPTY